MRTWVNNDKHEFCGCCGVDLPLGTVVLKLDFIGPNKGAVIQKVRCPLCAGEPMPAVLPVGDEIRGTTQPVRLSALPMPFDYKQASTGERE